MYVKQIFHFIILRICIRNRRNKKFMLYRLRPPYIILILMIHIYKCFYVLYARACKGCLLIPQGTRKSHLRSERTRHNIELYRRVSTINKRVEMYYPYFFLFFSANHENMVDIDPHRCIRRHIREDEVKQVGKQHFDRHLVQYRNNFYCDFAGVNSTNQRNYDLSLIKFSMRFYSSTLNLSNNLWKKGLIA